MQIFDKYLQVLTITLIFLQPVASKAKQKDPSRVNASSDFALPHFFPDVGYGSFSNFSLLLGDVKTEKSTGNSCQIEIHFSWQTSKFFIKYNLIRFPISGGLIIFFTEHDYKVSTSFIRENKRYK